MKAIDREQQAEAEIGHTTFSRGVPAMLTGLLLTTLFGLFVIERLQSDGVALVGDVLHLPPSARDISDTIAREGAWDGFFSLNRTMLGNMERLTTDLERSSLLRRNILPTMNQFFTGKLGARNADVARGRDGWLFYAPAVAHVTGPGFLTNRVARKGDPIQALAHFNEDLAARGITLVVVPLPVKATVCPEQLTAGAQPSVPLQNPSQEFFLHSLEEKGVLVCDVTTALVQAKANKPAYLARDSHWTPEGMHAAAEYLCNFLRTHVPGWTEGASAYHASAPETIRNAGDLAVMLSPGSTVPDSVQESVELPAVTGPDGKPWEPDPSGKILLLGDSFTNIYTLEGMGWGTHGGLGPWLSLLLQQPLDTITQNGDGAHATRLRLNQAIQRGEDRLAGKHVVIYEFAARELSLGDWKTEMRLASPEAHSQQPVSTQ